MKSLNLIKSINESTRAIRSLKKNSIEIDKAINLIFGTLKQKKKFLFVAMEDLQVRQNIFLQNF